MNISDIRKKYPQYDSVSDSDLADAFYKKHYEGKIDRADFDKRIGLESVNPIERHKRNVRKMIDGGATEQEIDGYLSGEGVTANDLRTATPGQSQGRARLEELRKRKRLSELRAKRDAAQNVQAIVPSKRKHKLPAHLQADANQHFQKAINKAGPIDRAIGSAISNLGHDFTLGADDHFSAAVGSLIPLGPERFGQYKNNLEIARQRRDIQTSKAPKSALVGRAAGLLGGGAALTKQGLTLASKAPKSVLTQAGAVGGDAAIGAGILAANEGRNPIKDIKAGP